MGSCTPGPREGGESGEPWSCEELWSPASVRANWAAAEDWAWKLVSTLSNDGKLALLGGAPKGEGYAGYMNAQSVLYEYQAALTMNDGPQGYNSYQERLAGTTTQYPCLLAVAASFDPEISRQYATAVAEEFVKKGSNTMLGPDVEVARVSLAGRSYETISGEDPFLGASLVQPFVRAVQSFGIISTVKHWLDNEQEIYRQSMDVDVDDRAQHEIYMPVFKAAFDAGAAGVMCSYNKVYGKFACENEKLLTTLLREKLGFKGFVVSDWGATHDGETSIRAGLSIEMPSGEHMATLPAKLEKDPELQKMFDQAAVRVVAAMKAVGQMDGKFPVTGWLPAGHLEEDGTSEEHVAVALKTIINSAVLLKNDDGTLPIVTKGKTIAMVGRYCDMLKDGAYQQGSVYAGGGSGFVDTNKGTTPLGSVRELITDATIASSVDGSSAKGADVAVLCVAAHGEEGWDRANNSLPEVKHLIQDVRKHNKKAKIVVFAIVPGSVETEWVEEVDAALLLFMPGEQVGPAFAKLLTGEESPSGRLPISFPKKDEKRLTQKQYPGWCDDVEGGWCDKMTAHFSESTLVGYRWNDAKAVPSAFPFGYGLAYTNFTYSGFSVACDDKSIVVSVNVTNRGERVGSVVPQLYVGFPSLKPVLRQLRGYKKVVLDAGFRIKVSFVLTEEDWSYFDVDADAWKSATDNGEDVEISVGDSSADLKFQHKLSCGAGAGEQLHFQQ